MPMPIPMTKALRVSIASPGNNALEVSPTRPVKAITGPEKRTKRSRAPDQPETEKVPMLQPNEITMLRKLIKTGETRWTTAAAMGETETPKSSSCRESEDPQRQPDRCAERQRVWRKEVVGGIAVEPKGQRNQHDRRADQQDAQARIG